MILYRVVRIHRKAIQRKINQLTSSSRRVSASKNSSMKRRKIQDSNNCVFGNCELDSHSDTIVAGSNCVVLEYIGQECDVSPYNDEYRPVKGVLIAHVETAWKSPIYGQTYILILNETNCFLNFFPHNLK